MLLRRWQRSISSTNAAWSLNPSRTSWTREAGSTSVMFLMWSYSLGWFCSGCASILQSSWATAWLLSACNMSISAGNRDCRQSSSSLRSFLWFQQYAIDSAEISVQLWTIHHMSCRRFTFWMSLLLRSMWSSTLAICFRIYRHFNAAMTPSSHGCMIAVVFAGRTVTFVFTNAVQVLQSHVHAQHSYLRLGKHGSLWSENDFQTCEAIQFTKTSSSMPCRSKAR